MKLFFLMCLMTSLVSCTQFGSSNALPLVKVTCSGFLGWDACYVSAREACPKGFNVSGQQESLITQARSMNYQCK